MFTAPLLTTPLLFAAVALSAVMPPPYIGLSIYRGNATDPCDEKALSFNLKPPVAWLSQSPESHCLPGLPADIHHVTCVTRRTTPLEGDTVLDTKVDDMAKCELLGFTETNCQGKYWTATKNDPLAKRDGTQSWIWTEEEKESGPDSLDIRSWQIDCLP